ncbi:MAG: hypothetical protein R6V39_07795, partial [Desulfovibrionales bacterium]
MRHYTLCYFSATAMEISSLSQGVDHFRKNDGKVTIYARTQTQLFDNSRQNRFVEQALCADIVIVTLHGGKNSFPAFDALLEALKAIPEVKRPYLHIQPTAGDEDSVAAAAEFSPGYPSEAWNRIYAYLCYGGHINYHQLLIYLHNRLFDTDEPCRPPMELPHEGIYHPDMP